jgi:DNA-binding winged helix-turn-helix (wHTH) protein
VRFQFADVIVDVEARQVRRAGVAVDLSPKAFDLLVILIRERHRALSRADLHAALWPDTFVSDASLAMLVAELRKAMGGSARRPGVVRTVHRHGYAFEGEVREVPTVPAAMPRHWLVTPTREIPLLPGENLVGRDRQVAVWLDSPTVSRQHAAVRVGADGVTVQDLGSKNGTRAGRVAVTTPMVIRDGDELRFGSVRVTFRTWAADATRSESTTS